MADDGPALALQAAIVAHLKGADAIKTGPLGDPARIFDSVPAAPAYPYVSIGADQELDDGADCIDGYEFSVSIDVYSQSPGFPEAKRIAHAVRSLLHEQEDAIDIENYRIVVMQFAQALPRREADNTSSVRMTFTALVETL